MTHPYRALPDTNFWKRSVVGVRHADFDPVTEAGVGLRPSDAIVTAGSCFAQHISRSLAADGFRFLVTEAPSEAEAALGARAIYSARYGNIYTTTQLDQLFDRAYGLAEPTCRAWTRPDGRLVDPFRPTEFPLGFADEEALEAERSRHYDAVRRAFEDCNVFVFTLGLTETWVCEQDGMAAPLAPGVVAEPPEGSSYRFENIGVEDGVRRLSAFVSKLAEVNPAVRVVLTVSPVPLEATYERRHVICSTTYSKAVLRVTAQALADALPERVTYFPSYEMVCAFPRADAFEDDLRSVRPAVVEQIMATFKAHHAVAADADAPVRPVRPSAPTAEGEARPYYGIEQFGGVICDEQLLGRP